MARVKATPGDIDERLPLRAAARFVGADLSPHTLRSWAKQKKVSYFKVGRRLYFARADLESLLSRSRVEAKS